MGAIKTLHKLSERARGEGLRLRPRLELRDNHQVVYIAARFAYFGLHCTKFNKILKKFIDKQNATTETGVGGVGAVV